MLLCYGHCDSFQRGGSLLPNDRLHKISYTSDALDTGAAYFEPSAKHPLGGFCCQHSHRDNFHIHELLTHLGLTESEARNRDTIRIIDGELHHIVDAAEMVLARDGQYFRHGGAIVFMRLNPQSGIVDLVPMNQQSLTLALSRAVTFEKFDGRTKGWRPCDPPVKVVSALFDSQNPQHLPILNGIAHQPFFSESDGNLVVNPGYDAKTGVFGAFDSADFTIPKPTREAAEEALVLIRDLLGEFAFAEPVDEAAALAAIFTAVVRPSLPAAPGYHAVAPSSGSGKSLLCDTIAYFASPGSPVRASYPATVEEATKSMLSMLMTRPAVIIFDDMTTDWIPHGAINRIFTAESVTDRVLGVSRTATVSTRTLFMGSGNNVGPVRDLLRRIVTIHLDSRSESPITRVYKGNPIMAIRENRGRYVAAVLTIILAWRKSGMSRSDVKSIATYGGAWADYCRHPLMWLGLVDPATSLFDQVMHDPDKDSLGELLRAWHATFRSKPTTVRKAISHAHDVQIGSSDLLDAIHEFPVEERGEINRSKLGWILKKNAGRIVDGLRFVQDRADGRIAWRVEVVTPASPPLSGSIPENIPDTVSAFTTFAPTFSADAPSEGGKGGDGGDMVVS